MSVTFPGRLSGHPSRRTSTAPSCGVPGQPGRRVRHQVRDGLAVAAFSAGASTVLALALTLVLRLAG